MIKVGFTYNDKQLYLNEYNFVEDSTGKLIVNASHVPPGELTDAIDEVRPQLNNLILRSELS